MILILALLALGCHREAVTPSDTTPPGGKPAADVAYWTCPMHPSVRAAGPGSCPICGMTLVPVSDGENSGAVTIPAEIRHRYGIETAPAEMRAIGRTIHGVGTVTWDARGLADVTLKFDGFVREARIVERGTPVRRGETMFTVYSPELLVAEEDLLSAVHQQQAGDPSAAVRADLARRRLGLLDVSPEQIDRIVASGLAVDALPVVAPASGMVLEAEVVAGQAVMKGERLYRIGDPSRVWVEAAIPAADARLVQIGSPAHIPGAEGKVAAILPSIDPDSRTATIRVEVPNAGGALVPDAWTSIDLDLGGQQRLAVPDSAILYTGNERLVFVDEGDDRLVPRTIRVGPTADGWTAVEDGLVVGDQVVVAGNFLVASDSRLRNGEGAW
jgi:Cu(I)/Ag(I) efflux system membrane fusion protein